MHKEISEYKQLGAFCRLRLHLDVHLLLRRGDMGNNDVEAPVRKRHLEPWRISLSPGRLARTVHPGK